MTKAKKWGSAEDAKLATLFSKPESKGGVNPKLLTKKDVEAARAKHFPDRPYASFSQVFRSKAAKWQLEKELYGGRRKGK